MLYDQLGYPRPGELLIQVHYVCMRIMRLLRQNYVAAQSKYQ